VATFAPVPSESPAVASRADADTLIRSVLFVAAFLAVATSLNPFPDLSNPPDITDTGDRVNQISYAALFLTMSAWVCFHNPGRLTALLRPILFFVLAWCAVTVVTSWAPALAARRFAFALVIMGIAALLLLLPKNLRHFSDLLAAGALILLALCYLGVFLAPKFAVHQVTDFVEPDLAGDWRGVFGHKNEAGPTMVMLIFIGLFVARARSLILGGIIVLFATPFLILTHSKTALTLVLPVLLISAVIERCRSAVFGVTITLAMVGAVSLFSFGSLYFPAIEHLLGSILPDPSFTGRTEIWQFALEHVARHPVVGYGFAAFWGTEQVVYGMGGSSIWENAVAQAHNSYVNLALTIGIPGSALAAVWLVVLPLIDYYRSAGAPGADPLRQLFLRVCLYGTCASSFESVFFQMGDAWFMLLIAVFGLRLLSVARLRA
jgi:O-antigen ligase